MSSGKLGPKDLVVGSSYTFFDILIQENVIGVCERCECDGEEIYVDIRANGCTIPLQYNCNEELSHDSFEEIAQN